MSQVSAAVLAANRAGIFRPVGPSTQKSPIHQNQLLQAGTERPNVNRGAFQRRLQSASEEADSRANSNQRAFSETGLQRSAGAGTFRLTQAGDAQLFTSPLPRGSLIDLQA